MPDPDDILRRFLAGAIAALKHPAWQPNGAIAVPITVMPRQAMPPRRG